MRSATPSWSGARLAIAALLGVAVGRGSGSLAPAPAARTTAPRVECPPVASPPLPPPQPRAAPTLDRAEVAPAPAAESAAAPRSVEEEDQVQQIERSGESREAWTLEAHQALDLLERRAEGAPGAPRDLLLRGRRCFTAGCSVALTYASQRSYEATHAALREDGASAWRGAIAVTPLRQEEDGALTQVLMLLRPQAPLPQGSHPQAPPPGTEPTR